MSRGHDAGRRPGPGLWAALILFLVLVSTWFFQSSSRLFESSSWTALEADLIASLALSSLPPLPGDPSNSIADNQLAAGIGKLLFSDARLSSNGEISCASCHQPERQFTDGLPVARALGMSRRNTPSIIGTAYSPWLYWDGRKDSQWAQALAPLEDPAEHGGNRMQLVRVLASPEYRQVYEQLFGALPDFASGERFPERAAPTGSSEVVSAWQAMSPGDQFLVSKAFSNLGKLLAAYERTLMPAPTRFDSFADALQQGNQDVADRIFTTREQAGLRLFIGKARCLECHNGPLFTNNEFHNTGLLPPAGETPDLGRIRVLDQVRSDPFNCLGVFSDAEVPDCPELVFMRTGAELLGAHRTPSLRNLALTAPYMHKGQLGTLAEILDHYNRAPLALVGHNEAEPLNLGARELEGLEAFIRTLAEPSP